MTDMNTTMPALFLGHGNPMNAIEYEQIGPDAAMAAPTPEHYPPLRYLMGVCRPGEPISFPVEGFDGGTISMLAVRGG